ncbi:hypothetical protein L195_g061126 [Trifolium pratense]|uniref:Uncharacterized protein n=1 Tax=Trifolium pratense TaxID=57577 RepID=A0A2K3K801_TRIPR|nr:hypothetical protein L195_g061126 [Trifolium pratense]
MNKRKEVVQAPTVQQRLGPKTFVPANHVPANRVPVNQWANGRYVAFNKKILERGASSQGTQQNALEAKKYSYRNNYMGKNPMTQTQWRRFQRQKKQESQKGQAGGNAVMVKLVEIGDPMVEKP